MAMDRKLIRKLSGYTFSKVDTNHKNWYDRACQFRGITDLFHQHRQEKLNQAYYFNMGLSLEIMLKAIIISKAGKFSKIHSLVELSKLAEISITSDQECTLELLSEIVVWSGRYPTPKTEEHWDRYHDNIFEKHIIRSSHGNTHRVMANEDRFPNQNNYDTLWNLLSLKYNSVNSET